MKKYLIGILVVIILFFILGLLPELKQPAQQNIYKTATVSLGSTTVNVEIADTAALQVLGLSGRQSLEDGSAMLFVFNTPDKYGFWMKDMKFSLDMVWADNGKIIYIEKSVSPNTFPKIFEPPSPARFVLELPAGFCDTHSLKVGDFFSTGL